MCLSRNSSASHRKYSMTIPNCVLAIIQLHLVENILIHFQIMSESKQKCISSKLFYDNPELCLSHNSIVSHLNYSETIPNCVWAEIQLHLVEKILRYTQIVSQSKFKCISSNSLYDNSKLCLSHNSIATYLKFSKTIPNCVWAETQLHLMKVF